MSLEDRGTGDAELAAEISELELRQRIAPTERRSRIVQHLTFLRELQAMRAARAPDRGRVRAVVDGAIRGMARYPSGHQVLPNDTIYAIADRVADQLYSPAPKPHHAGRQAIPVINPTDTPELRDAIAKLSKDGRAEMFGIGSIGSGGGGGSGGVVTSEWIARKKDLDAKIPGFTVGTGGGAGMAKSGDPSWQSRVHAAADKIDRGANVVATPPDEEHPLGQVSVTPRRIAVELVLDKLERFAKRSAANASRQHWVAEKDGNSGICSVVSSDAVEPEDMICETITEADADHVVAAQPAAILALIATVREMIPLVKDWASKERAEAAQIGWTVDSDFETILNRALTVEAP